MTHVARRPQVLLINAVKDVAAALGDLISATKNASGKAAHDPAMAHLKESAKVMVTNVTSLLKTVKTVEDETARGTRALEASIDAINQDIRVRMMSSSSRSCTETLMYTKSNTCVHNVKSNTLVQIYMYMYL